MKIKLLILCLCFIATSMGSQRAISWAFLFGGYKGIVSLGMDVDAEKKFLTEPLNDARREYMPDIDFSWRDWMWSLYKLERAFCNGSLVEVQNEIGHIVKKKSEISRLSSGRGSRWYSYYIIILEYSLIRLVQDQSDVVQQRLSSMGDELISVLLPEEDFDLNAPTKDYSQSAYSLRNMIALEMKIEQYTRKTGRIPVEISAVAPDGKFVLDGYGRLISYTLQDGTWLLYSAGPKNEPNKMPFDVYVPYVLFADHNGFHRVLPLWLSPSYSQKQWEWYRSRCLYKGTPHEYRMPQQWF